MAGRAQEEVWAGLTAEGKQEIRSRLGKSHNERFLPSLLLAQRPSGSGCSQAQLPFPAALGDSRDLPFWDSRPTGVLTVHCEAQGASCSACSAAVPRPPWDTVVLD